MPSKRQVTNTNHGAHNAAEPPLFVAPSVEPSEAGQPQAEENALRFTLAEEQPMPAENQADAFPTPPNAAAGGEAATSAPPAAASAQAGASASGGHRSGSNPPSQGGGFDFLSGLKRGAGFAIGYAFFGPIGGLIASALLGGGGDDGGPHDGGFFT